MKKRILLDVDGVLADFHRRAFEFLAARFGLTHDPHDFPSWDIFATVNPEHREETEAHWSTPGWCASIPAYEGAREGVDALRQVADVYFITAQMTHSPHWMWERVRWLEQEMGADERHVVFTLSKYLIVGDVLVDDKIANVTSWAEHHPTGTAVVWDQPWNRDGGHDLVRASRWEQLLLLV